MADIKQYVFFDFEMLCSNRGMLYDDMEAIRLGAVKYDITTETVSFFDHYIKPTNRKPLSQFCKDLTGITDSDLAHAANFTKVFEEFLYWVGGVKRSRFFSWSKSDLSRLKIDSLRHKIPQTTINKIEQRYVDFQAIFSKRVTKSHFSVENALAVYGLDFVGEKHNPMYDAYNTLQIYLSFLNNPIKSDLTMLKQHVFKHVPKDEVYINSKLRYYLKRDIEMYMSDLRDIYKIKHAKQKLKKTQRLVEKYENVLINRSGLFSEDLIVYIRMLLEFYHELLLSYDEHHQHGSKIMILDEYIVNPLQQLKLSI